MVAGRKPQTGFVVRQAFAIQRSAQAPFSCLRTDCKQALKNPPSRSAARCGPACAACWPRRCTGARRRAGQLAAGRSRPIPARDCAWRLPANKNISATAKPDGRELSDSGSAALLKARLITGPMQGQGGRGAPHGMGSIRSRKPNSRYSCCQSKLAASWYATPPMAKRACSLALAVRHRSRRKSSLAPAACAGWARTAAARPAPG